MEDVIAVAEAPIIGECIFCDKNIFKNSNEHIVPESLGNRNYVLPNGAICRKCNNRFSDFEEKALTKTFLGFERARMGIPTKKGNPAIAKSNGIEWTGNKDFKRNIVNVKGFTQDQIKNFNEKTGSFELTVPDFDKSEMATSKLLLKMGYEALFTSQKKIFQLYDFEEIKQHLTNKNNADWPFLSTTNLMLSTFKSIPKFQFKHDLNRIRCQLLISEINQNTLIFKFKYSVALYMINLIDRNIEWTKEYLEKDKLINIYPEYFKKK